MLPHEDVRNRTVFLQIQVLYMPEVHRPTRSQVQAIRQWALLRSAFVLACAKPHIISLAHHLTFIRLSQGIQKFLVLPGFNAESETGGLRKDDFACERRLCANVKNLMKASLMKKKLMKKPLPTVICCCVLAAWALSGCANSAPGSRRSETVIDRSGVDIIASDVTRQLTYLKERGSTERFCRGPGADAVTTASQGVSAQVPLRGSSVGLGEESTNGAVDLGGRNPAVLIARELMYRACELASNTNADAATERLIYMQFLQAIATISKGQTGTGVAALASEPVAPVLLPPPPASAQSPISTPASSSLVPALSGSTAQPPAPDLSNTVPGS